jgi:hypothetical protein
MQERYLQEQDGAFSLRTLHVHAHEREGEEEKGGGGGGVGE